MQYLAIGNNAKTIKSDNGGEYLTAIMYLLPDDDLCPMSRLAQCQAPCLNTAGRGAFSNVQQARAAKTAAFKRDPVAFVDAIAADVRIALRKAAKLSVRLVVRLNGTSDIPWEHMRGSDGKTLFELFPDVQFYDYTKLPGRKVPVNYHLTVSYSGANPAYARKALDPKHGHNVAVVFDTPKGKPLPIFWGGRRVIDGDLTDLRFTDPDNVIVGLRAKGQARSDASGFVVRLAA
jgi:hypothetical protein